MSTPTPTAVPELARPSKYWARGRSKLYWLLAIDSEDLVPTRPEMLAGTDITRVVAEFSGWSTTAAEIDAPNLGERFTEKHPGAIEAADSNLSLYADSSGQDSRQLMPEDAEGFLQWCDGGDVTGSLSRVFPVRVRSCSLQPNMGNELDRVMHQFSITQVPNLAAEIP